jgi:hypothetical protein
MRYLKAYKLFESENYLHNESINWELINDAKDLSLDNLDEGLSLEYKVDYIKGGLKPIIIGYYSHEKDKLNWKWGKTTLKEDYISYSFFFNKGGILINNYVDYVEQSEELINTLKIMYPDVKLTNDRWANYGPVQALKQHLVSEHDMDELDVYSIIDNNYTHYDAKVYEYEGMEFTSQTYGEAMESAKQYVDGLVDEEVLNVDLYFRFDCVDEDSLVDSLIDEEYYRQDWKYIEGIEADEDGNIDEESLKKYIEIEKDNIKYDIKDYIKSHFGKEKLHSYIKGHLTSDWLKKMTEGIVRSDGLGQTLSNYDGEEHLEEYDGVDYYIFRIN